MVLCLLILLAVIAAPLEPVEAQYRSTCIVRVKQTKGPKWVQTGPVDAIKSHSACEPRQGRGSNC